jgi:hypothetical protein
VIDGELNYIRIAGEFTFYVRLSTDKECHHTWDGDFNEIGNGGKQTENGHLSRPFVQWTVVPEILEYTLSFPLGIATV